MPDDQGREGDADSFPCLFCDAPVPLDRGTPPRSCPACFRALVACGTYRVHGLLGKGGMGKVYAARSEPDGEEVAVKVLVPREAGDWTAWELFERSSTVLRGLDHKALPRVYAFERAEPARLILVREAFDGGTLRDRIQGQDRRLPQRRVRALLVELLELLAYLAELVPPVVHRDIKPANIMFRTRDDWDPVLVDFDTVAAPRGLGSGLTIVGTPGYTAPEQFAGDATPASDLYSLGATMLSVVTHRDADDLPRREGRFEVADLLGGLDDGLRRVLLKMVEPDRHARYATARAALADVVHGGPRAQEAAPAAPEPPAGPVGEVVAKHGGAFHGNAARYDTNDYIGRVSQGARVRLLDRAVCKNEFGLHLVKVLVLTNEWSDERGRVGWVNLDATSFRDHFDPKTQTVAGDFPDVATPPPAPAPASPAATAAAGRSAMWKSVGVALAILVGAIGVGHALFDKPASRRTRRPARTTRTTTPPVVTDTERERRDCEAGKAAACYQLAARYDNGRGVGVDKTRAVGLYERACRGGHGDACNDLGVMLVTGSGGAADPPRGAGLYRDACERGVALSCRNLGYLHLEGKGVPRDEARGAGLFERACTLGDMPACNSLGFAYDRGRGVKRDHARAASFYARACDGGDLMACKNLGLSYYDGEGVARDDARAVGLFRRACDGDHSDACRYLARAYAAGRGVPADRDRALRLLGQACRGGVKAACEDRERARADGGSR